MYPPELDYKTLKLPPSDDYSIVIITGKELRHKRFAYRLIEEFGDRVVVWYEIDDTIASNTTDVKSRSKIDKIISRLYKIPKWLSKQSASSLFGKICSIVDDLNYRFFVIRGVSKRMRLAEERLFSQEIDRIKRCSDIEPQKVSSRDIHSKEFIDNLRQISPYFILTLSGPLYRDELLSCARGVAINQHAGDSPKYKGSNTIHWALYHRDLDSVSSTVHITISGADAGAILRRSQATVFPNDSIETIFIRSVALGTELMIESIREIIEKNSIIVFPQPKYRGRTYLNRELSFSVMKAIYRDFRNGWLKDALERRRVY